MLTSAVEVTLAAMFVGLSVRLGWRLRHRPVPATENLVGCAMCPTRFDVRWRWHAGSSETVLCSRACAEAFIQSTVTKGGSR